MKFALCLFVMASSAAAFAAPSISAQRCTNPGRGLVLMLPEISGGALTGEFRLTHLDHTLVSIAPEDVRDLSVADDGRAFSFRGNDSKGTEITRVKTTHDSINRLVVQVWIKDRGMIGFACPNVKAN